MAMCSLNVTCIRVRGSILFLWDQKHIFQSGIFSILDADIRTQWWTGNMARYDRNRDAPMYTVEDVLGTPEAMLLYIPIEVDYDPRSKAT